MITRLCVIASIACVGTAGCSEKKDNAPAQKEATPAPKSKAAATETQQPAKTPTLDASAAAAPSVPKALPTDPADIVLENFDATSMTVVENDELKEFVAFEKHHAAADFCIEDTMINPGDLVAYRIKGRPEIVFHCPGSLDGVPNAVSVFSPTSEPKTARVSPPSSSHIIEQEALQKTVLELLSK